MEIEFRVLKPPKQNKKKHNVLGTTGSSNVQTSLESIVVFCLFLLFCFVLFEDLIPRINPD